MKAGFSGDYKKLYKFTSILLTLGDFMVLKTLSDCTRCPHIAECDAHISGGNHKHLQGPDPCELDFKQKSDGF